MTWVVWAWRVVPNWTVQDDIAGGFRMTETDARKAVETAIHDPKAVAGMVCPLAYKAGKWRPVTKPVVGLRSQDGAIAWIERTLLCVRS